jgi:hypothetical protein
MMSLRRFIRITAITVIFVFSTGVCFAQAVKTFDNAAALKEYLNGQSFNSPNKPITVKMNVYDFNLKGVVDVLKATGKFVNLDLSVSPLTNIPPGTFKECTTLAGIIIPNSVSYIGDNAFNNCANLISVTIPGAVTSIMAEAFNGCISLTTINVAADSASFSSKDGILYNKDKTTLIAYPSVKGSFTIPGSVKNISDKAFKDCSNLKSVTIPNSVTNIGGNAFQNCTALTSVTIGIGITGIGEDAFRGCTSLTSVTFEGPLSPNAINNKAFNTIGGLRDKFLAQSGGRGTYTRAAGGSTWTKKT